METQSNCYLLEQENLMLWWAVGILFGICLFMFVYLFWTAVKQQREITEADKHKPRKPVTNEKY